MDGYALLLGHLPEALALMGVIATVLPMRHKPLFIAAFLPCAAAFWTSLPAYPLLAALCACLALVVLPAALYESDNLKKALAIAIASLASLVGRALALGVEALFPPGSGVIPALLGQLANVVWLLAAGVCLHRLLVRLHPTQEMDAASLFAAFPASQAVLAITFLSTVFPWHHLLDGSTRPAVALALALSVCLVADMLVFSHINRYMEYMEASRRERSAAARLDEALSGYDALAAPAEQVARVRHDVRNHLQVIDVLLERGERDAALEYANQLVERIRQAGIALDEGGPCHADGGGSAREAAPDETGSRPEPRGRLDRAGAVVPLMAVYPLSQAGIVAWAVATAGVHGLPAATVVPVCIVALACIPYDVALMRAVRDACARGLARRRAATLEELAAAQHDHLESVESMVERARSSRARMLGDATSLRDTLETADAAEARRMLDVMAVRARPAGGGYCAHPAVDALLAVKVAACRAAGVEPRITASVPVRVGVDARDLCAVLANLLDNAIAAQAGVDPGVRAIEAVATVRAGLVMIEVRNACLPGSQVPARRAEVGDEHGWGVAIVREVARRYGGDATFEVAQGVFRAAVTLPERRGA